MEDQANKVHRKSKVGKKAEKKDAQDKKKRGLDTSRHNAKVWRLPCGMERWFFVCVRVIVCACACACAYTYGFMCVM